jgi:hypothetical protein
LSKHSLLDNLTGQATAHFLEELKMTELTLATWPERTGTNQFGITHYSSEMDCYSFWLTLRAVDKDGSSDYDLSCIGLFVWFSKTQIVIEPRLHDVHSMDLRKLEKVIKVLRKMCAKVPGQFRTVSPLLALAEAFDALKIKRSTEYRHLLPDQYSNVLAGLAGIVDIIEAKRKEFK